MPPTIPPPIQRFKATLQTAFEALIEAVMVAQQKGFQGLKPEMIRLLSTLVLSYDDRIVIETFITHSSAYWDMIRERNEEFFTDHAHLIFSGFPLEQIDPFRQLFQKQTNSAESYISAQLKEDLWNNFEALIKISLRYICERRLEKPDYYEEINVEKEAKKSGMKL